MEKETITKDDGRLLTYYWFGCDTECPSEETAEAGHSSLITHQPDSPSSPA